MSAETEQQQKGSRSRIANYQKILANNPRSYIFAQLAEEYLKLGEIEKAVEICRNGLQYNPEFSDGTYVLGVALFKKGLTDQAKNIFMRILKKQPEHYLAREALHRLGYDDARIAEESVRAGAGELTAEGGAEEPASFSSMQAGEGSGADLPGERGEGSGGSGGGRRDAAQLLSARRSVPFAAGDIRTAYRPDQSSAPAPAERDKEAWPPWVKTLLVVGILVIVGLGSLAVSAVMKYKAKQEVAELYFRASEDVQRDTFEGYQKVVPLLEKGIAAYPDALNLKALLVEVYGRLLISFDHENLDWQRRMEALFATFPAESFADSDLLSAQAFRALAINKPGDVRFLIDTAGEKGLLTPSMTCLDGELQAFDRKFAEAIRLYEEALKDDPKLMRALFKKAAAQIELRDYSGAKVTLNLLLEKEPGHLGGRILLMEAGLFGGQSAREVQKDLNPFFDQQEKTLPPVLKARLYYLRAAIDFQLNRPVEALAEAKQSVTLDAGPKALYLLTQIQFDQKQFDTAEQSIRRAVDMSPEDKSYHALLGRIYFLRDNKTRALEQMEFAIDESTQEFDLLVIAGDAAAMLKMYDKAVQYYERALYVNFENHDLKKKLILTLIEKQDAKEARRRIDKLLADAPDDPMTCFLNGHYYLAEGNAARAEKEFERGLSLDPNHRDTLLAIAGMEMQRGEAGKAFALYRRLLESYPEDKEVLGILAAYAFSADAQREAREAYGKLARLEPQMGIYRLYLAYLDFTGGKRDEAEKVVESELAKDPNLGFAHILRGVFLLLQGDIKRAEPQIQQGVKLESKNPEGHYWLGRIKLANNDKTWAESEFEIAVECQPFFPRARYEIGMIAFEKGQFEQARKMFSEALAAFNLFPDNKTYPVKIMLRLGEIEISMNRYRHGLDLLRRASEMDPEAGEPYYLLARDSPDKFANPEKTLRLLKKARELDPALAAVHYETGMVYMSRDRNKEAAAEFSEYLRLDPKGRFAEDARQQVERLSKK